MGYRDEEKMVEDEIHSLSLLSDQYSDDLEHLKAI